MRVFNILWLPLVVAACLGSAPGYDDFTSALGGSQSSSGGDPSVGGGIIDDGGCSLGAPFGLWDVRLLSGADSSVIDSIPNTGSGSSSWDVSGSGSNRPVLRTAGNCTGGSGQCAQFDVTDFLSMASPVTQASTAQIICVDGYFPDSGSNRNPVAWRDDFSRHTLRISSGAVGTVYLQTAGTPTFTVTAGWHSICFDVTDRTDIPIAVDGVAQTNINVSVGASVSSWHFTFGGYSAGGGGSYANFELGRAAFYNEDPGLTVAQLSACSKTLFAQSIPGRDLADPAVASRYFGVTGTEQTVNGTSLTAYESSIPDEFAFSYSDSSTTLTQTLGAAVFSPATTGDFVLTMDINGVASEQTPSFHSSTIAASSTFTALLVGDSLTAGQTYPSRVDTATTGKGTFVGTQGTGTSHEGHSGKTWEWFGSDAASPMTDGSGTLDLASYISGLSATPTHVVWLLGTNKIFTADLGTIDTTVTAELDDAETIINAWPGSGVVHAFALTLPGLADDSGFVSYDPALQSWWTWRQKQNAMALGILDRFGGREGEDIYIIPTNASVDGAVSSGDYPSNNGLHPSTQGYEKLGDTVAAFLLWVNRV